MESHKEKEARPEAFRDLSKEVQRNWALQAETQLFLAQLRQDRENAADTLDAVCAPSVGGNMNEFRVEARAKFFVYSLCVNTIEDAMGEAAHV